MLFSVFLDRLRDREPTGTYSFVPNYMLDHLQDMVWTLLLQ